MTLYVGYKAADIHPAMLNPGAVFHTLDIYHRHAIEKVFHGQARAICMPHLPATPSAAGLAVAEGAVDRWERVVFRTGPKLMSGELSLDLLQECVRIGGAAGIHALPTGKDKDVRQPRAAAQPPPGVTLEFVGRERDRNDLLDKVRDRVDREFKSEWRASVPGGAALDFISCPGCFCHRRLDEGGLALAEVVTRDLAAAPLPAANLRLLDMGCGCGLVGLLVGDFLRGKTAADGAGCDLVMIDSHTRAVEAATENAARLGIPAEVILSDNGCPKRMDASFDVFVGNPPYYSDYRIADVFLETARRALKPGGVCYTVCKNAAGLEPVQKKYFPETEIIRRRGYAVLKSHVPA